MEWTEVKKVVGFICNRMNKCFFLFENMKLGFLLTCVQKYLQEGMQLVWMQTHE